MGPEFTESLTAKVIASGLSSPCRMTNPARGTCQGAPTGWLEAEAVELGFNSVSPVFARVESSHFLNAFSLSIRQRFWPHATNPR